MIMISIEHNHLWIIYCNTTSSETALVVVVMIMISIEHNHLWIIYCNKTSLLIVTHSR
jgi:hypothetical protein